MGFVPNSCQLILCKLTNALTEKERVLPNDWVDCKISMEVTCDASDRFGRFATAATIRQCGIFMHLSDHKYFDLSGGYPRDGMSLRDGFVLGAFNRYIWHEMSLQDDSTLGDLARRQEGDVWDHIKIRFLRDEGDCTLVEFYQLLSRSRFRQQEGSIERRRVALYERRQLHNTNDSIHSRKRIWPFPELFNASVSRELYKNWIADYVNDDIDNECQFRPEEGYSNQTRLFFQNKKGSKQRRVVLYDESLGHFIRRQEDDVADRVKIRFLKDKDGVLTIMEFDYVGDDSNNYPLPSGYRLPSELVALYGLEDDGGSPTNLMVASESLNLPLMGWVKLIPFTFNHVFEGVVARDWTGCWLVGIPKTQGVLDFAGIRKGLGWALDKGLQNVIIESDSHRTIEILKHGIRWSPRTSERANRCWELLDRACEVCFRQTSLGNRQATNGITAFKMLRDLHDNSLNDPPRFIFDIIVRYLRDIL